jgi:hypothetical protein
MEQKMKKECLPEIISLKDLYISSYLKAKGFPLHDATLDERGRTIFHFQETPELTKALKEYYAGTALVSPSTFIESFKGLRSLAYSLSGDLKKNMYGEKYGKADHRR